MRVTCGTYGDKKIAYRIFGGKTQKGEATRKQAVDGSIILKQFLKQEGSNQNNVVRGTDNWRDLLIKVKQIEIA